MKKFNRVQSLLATLTLLVFLPLMGGAAAEDAFGSSAVTAGQTYTLEQMLTYAIQDEYMAQAEYQGILDTLGGDAPFSNILKAEGTHINYLVQLFTTYGLPVPSNTAADRVTLPATLADAYQAGVTAEVANIAMYDTFLAQTDLPTDVRDTFTALKNASENHLNAYTRNASRNGQNWGMQNGRGRNNGAMGNATTQTGACGNCNTTCTLYDNTGAQRQGNMNGKGRQYD